MRRPWQRVAGAGLPSIMEARQGPRLVLELQAVFHSLGTG